MVDAGDDYLVGNNHELLNGPGDTVREERARFTESGHWKRINKEGVRRDKSKRDRGR